MALSFKQSTEREDALQSAHMVVLMGARVDATWFNTLMFFATLRLSLAAIALTIALSGTGGLYINAPCCAT